MDMISHMQALAHSPTVVERIRDALNVLPADGLGHTAGTVVLALADGNEGQSPINPVQLVSAIKASHKYLGHGAQEDAEEAFLILVSALFVQESVHALRPGFQGYRSLGSSGWPQGMVRRNVHYGERQGSTQAGLASIAGLELAANHLCSHRSLALPPPLEDPVFAGRTVWHAATPPNMLRPTQDRADAKATVDVASVVSGVPGETGQNFTSGCTMRPENGIWLPGHGCSGGRGLAALEQASSGWGAAAAHPAMGLLSSTLRCAECGSQQQLRVDSFSDLSLSLPLATVPRLGVRIEDCLSAWGNPELVEGARCDGCLHHKTLEHIRRRRASISTLRSLAPNSLGAAELAAEDSKLQGIEVLLSRQGPTHWASHEATQPQASQHRTFSLAEGIRSECTALLGSQAAGKIVRRLRMARAPTVLCLHLRRVVASFNGASIRKDSSRVRFGLELDVSPLLEPFSFSQGAAACVAEGGGHACGQTRGGGIAAGKATYQLVAVVEHLGGAQGGHYVSYVRRGHRLGPSVPRAAARNEAVTWILFNDCRSKHVRPFPQ
jgi:hypothetical protein